MVEFLIVRAITLTLNLGWALSQDNSHTPGQVVLSKPYQQSSHCFDNPSQVSISHCMSRILFLWFLTLTPCLYWDLYSGIHCKTWEGLGGNRPSFPQWQRYSCSPVMLWWALCPIRWDVLGNICAESIIASGPSETNTLFSEKTGRWGHLQEKGSFPGCSWSVASIMFLAWHHVSCYTEQLIGLEMSDRAPGSAIALLALMVVIF